MARMRIIVRRIGLRSLTSARITSRRSASRRYPSAGSRGSARCNRPRLRGGVAGGSLPPPRAAWATTAGAAWRPWRWLELVVDAHAELGCAAALDVFALAPALRFAIGAHFGAELGAMLPLAGRERALAAADLRVSVRL